MVKDIGHSYKYYRSKISTSTLKKPILSSPANNTSYTTNLTPTIMSYQLQHKDSTSIQNTSYISNTDDIQSCVTSRKQNISVQATSTTTRLASFITTLPLLPVELPKTTHLPPLGKAYLCFRVDNKSPHAAQCVKSRVLNKAIDSSLSINIFEKQCVVIKYMLQSSRLEDHMKTIGIDLSSFTRSSFEHRCMNNIKKIYQHAGKCYDQQNLQDIIDADILCTPEGVTDNSHNVYLTSSPVKKSSARKSLCLFTTYWMLNLQQPNAVLLLQNPDAKP